MLSTGTMTGRSPCVLDHVAGVVGLGDRIEGEVVGVLDALDAGDLDAQAERVRVVLLGPQLEDLLPGGLGDGHDHVVRLPPRRSRIMPAGKRSAVASGGAGRRTAHQGVSPSDSASSARASQAPRPPQLGAHDRQLLAHPGQRDVVAPPRQLGLERGLASCRRRISASARRIRWRSVLGVRVPSPGDGAVAPPPAAATGRRGSGDPAGPRRARARGDAGHLGRRPATGERPPVGL